MTPMVVFYGHRDIPFYLIVRLAHCSTNGENSEEVIYQLALLCRTEDSCILRVLVHKHFTKLISNLQTNKMNQGKLKFFEFTTTYSEAVINFFEAPPQRSCGGDNACNIGRNVVKIISSAKNNPVYCSSSRTAPSSVNLSKKAIDRTEF